MTQPLLNLVETETVPSEKPREDSEEERATAELEHYKKLVAKFRKDPPYASE